MKKKRRKKAGRKRATSAGLVNVQDLVSAKSFADSVGGVENAQELLDGLRKLS